MIGESLRAHRKGVLVHDLLLEVLDVLGRLDTS